jgi:hypothetical protein
VSKSYNDAVTTDYTPALQFDSADEAERTLKYCNVYDNGTKEFPELVKQKSKLPDKSAGCREGQTFCLGGAKQGTQCAADSECGDGKCDACLVQGGVTTEDEMFILLGDFYVVPPK